MPMAASSAMMPAMVSAEVSPGMAIISRPTEQTARHGLAAFQWSGAPHWAGVDHARVFRNGDKGAGQSADVGRGHDAALFHRVIEQWPARRWCRGRRSDSRPISSRMCATESPTAGVGARERSTMPKGTPRRVGLASVATSWPIRVILKAVFFTDVGDRQ